MTDSRGPDSAGDVGGTAVESEYARRSVLRGALALGTVGIGGALTGCGGGSSNSSSSTSTQASTPVGGANAAAAPTPAASTAPAPAASTPAAPAASGAGTSLGLASKIPVGGGVIFEKANVVVTQPTAGVYKAFSATCTHQTCILADVSGGFINCACHGSKFSITNGDAVKPPAVDPLPAKKVTVAGGKVIVS